MKLKVNKAEAKVTDVEKSSNIENGGKKNKKTKHNFSRDIFLEKNVSLWYLRKSNMIEEFLGSQGPSFTAQHPWN